MVELRWTGEAAASLKDVHDHIARDRPTTARRTVESIVGRVESLVDYPAQGQLHPYPRHRGVRVLTYGQFQVAYLLEGERSITVLGVFHGLIFLPLK